MALKSAPSGFIAASVVCVLVLVRGRCISRVLCCLFYSFFSTIALPRLYSSMLHTQPKLSTSSGVFKPRKIRAVICQPFLDNVDLDC
ncbi:hypothetical protein GCK32_022651 [Trichostrongylus colubriformis]|uniref:Uncharacterized protein n=1 Tax=Trichostrongylus colubriformis TaxID=6319 RepID=A0AAN8FHW4_TRICO